MNTWNIKAYDEAYFQYAKSWGEEKGFTQIRWLNGYPCGYHPKLDNGSVLHTIHPPKQ